MLLQELNDLKEGDQVAFNAAFRCLGQPERGTILTRKKCWMDDDLCVRFNFTVGDKEDFHYFNHAEVEFIENGIKE